MEVDGPCIVCEKCNVGKVLMKLPIGDRVTQLSKTPLTELLSSLLKEVVTKDMMLCAQCLKCLNKKDKLMVLEKRGLGPGAKPRGGRGRGGRGASRGRRAGASLEQEESSSQSRVSARGRGRGRKGSGSSLNVGEPSRKISKLDEAAGLSSSMPRLSEAGGIGSSMSRLSEAGDAGSTMPRLSEAGGIATNMSRLGETGGIGSTMPRLGEAEGVGSCMPRLSEAGGGEAEATLLVPNASEAADMPCITAIKDEVLSDEEREHQTTEICINKDTVVATTTPQCPEDPLALHAGELFNCDLIKSEITVDGDDCVVGLRCVDESAPPSATVHVVSSIDIPAPSEDRFSSCGSPPLSSDASTSLSSSFACTPIDSVVPTTMHLSSDDVAVTVHSFTNILSASKSTAEGSINDISTTAGSTSASFIAKTSLASPISISDGHISEERRTEPFCDKNEDCLVLNGSDINANNNNNIEEEAIYVDMPEISPYDDRAIIVETTNTTVTTTSHSLITANSAQLSQESMVCIGGSVFPCSLCPNSFSTAGALRHHHEQCHNKLKRIQCLNCPFYSTDALDVEDHMKNEHRIKPQHFCKFCQAEFILKDSHLNHIKLVHRIKNNRYYDKLTPSTVYRKKIITCPHCDHPFMTEKDLLRHNKAAHDGEKFPCHYCSFKCSSYKTWTRHDAETHKKKSKIIHTCPECKIEFDTEIGLEAHCANKHVLERTHRCKLCGDLFITAAMLRFHLTKHNPYTCPICNVGFKKLENYQAHLSNIHNNDRPGLILQEVPGQENAILSSRNSDAFESRDLTAEEVTSPTKVLQLSSNFVQTQRAASVLAQSTGGDGESRQYDEEIAEDYLKQVRGTPYNQKVPCIFCFKEVTAGHLRTHFKNHSGVTPFACDFCSKVCIQSTNLRKHVRTKHPEHFRSWDSSAKTPKKKSFSCEFCDVVCEGIDEYEVHLWEHMSSKEHECALCKTRFGLENNLKEHMKTHYFETLQTCEHCKRTFKNIGAYNEHVENCKNQWTCPTCGLCLQSENKFRKHMKSTHSGSDVYKYVCTEPGCGRKYFEKHRYDDHCITHESERRYQCPHCHKRFKRLRPLNEHIKCKHDGARCLDCETLFTSLDQLAQHRIESHSSSFHECPECGLPFLHDTTLANHTRCHHPVDDVLEMPQCHICDELFSTDAALTAHFTEHHKGSYICCAFGCYSSAACEDDLRDHLSSEHAGLDYECVYCQMDHMDEAALRRHYLDLHGKESFCKICAAPFYKDDLLQKHASQHGDRAKYWCDDCDFACGNRHSMVSHFTGTHGVSSAGVKSCIVQQRVYGCSACTTITLTLEAMNQHIPLHEASDNAEMNTLLVPNKLESDTLECPVCSVPWPNMLTIMEHLEESKSCDDLLSQLNRCSRDQDSGTTQIEMLGKEIKTEAPEVEFSLIPNSVIVKSENVSVEAPDQDFLTQIGDVLLTGGDGETNGAVVKLNGDHYVVWEEPEEDAVEALVQQQSSYISGPVPPTNEPSDSPVPPSAGKEPSSQNLVSLLKKQKKFEHEYHVCIT